jgi:uncharacterized protein (TIGR02145 family)
LSLPEPFLTIIIYLNFFHMRKVFFLMLTLLMLSVASMNAQVRIGGIDDPNQSTVLDLNATDDANSGGLGLALPRVVLTSATAQLNDAVPPNGTVVYNTGGNLSEGIYYWAGGTSGQWVYVSGFVPKITTQPARFTFGRLKDIAGDPNAPDFTEKALTIVASGLGLSYQWYQKAKNPNAPDIELTNATTPTYTFPAPAEGVANWGLYQYYCVVSNVYGSVKSDLAEIAVGCGAKTVTGGWLKFMCYNLGADTNADPFTFIENTSTILGDLYQWGRMEPIARTAEVPVNFIAAPDYPYDWKIPNGYKTAISDSYHQDDFLWRNDNIDPQAPCPVGWHLPSITAFGAIYNGRTDTDKYSETSANTWTPTGQWSYASANSYGSGGLAVKPDGNVITLFFPAAGQRVGTDGSLYGPGREGLYWSSDAGGSFTSFFWLRPDQAKFFRFGGRAYSYSVRCIAL